MPTGKLTSKFGRIEANKKQSIPKPKPKPGKKIAKPASKGVTVPKTEHPGKTEFERAILDQIGCGGYVINNLLNKDVKYAHALEDLVRAGKLQDVSSSDRRKLEFQMDIPTHMQWCRYHTENLTDEDKKELGLDD